MTLDRRRDTQAKLATPFGFYRQVMRPKGVKTRRCPLHKGGRGHGFYDGQFPNLRNQVRLRPPEEARVTPPITSEPPTSWTSPIRSPNVSTAITAVNTGMRFKKIDPLAAPMPSMPTLQAIKAATEAKTPTYTRPTTTRGVIDPIGRTITSYPPMMPKGGRASTVTIVSVASGDSAPLIRLRRTVWIAQVTAATSMIRSPR